jgi:DNA-binding NtrC family response regulator
MADLLIVDDDLDMADLLAEVLRADGHEVRVAGDGAEGLRLIQTKTPDLVLLDVEMPILTGPDLAHALLVHDLGLETIPLVLSSGILQLDKIADEVGTPYFLAKPYGFDALNQLLASALTERRAPSPRTSRSPP